MLVKIMANELYPVYNIHHPNMPEDWPYDYQVDVPEDLFERYWEMMDEYHEVQRLLEQICKASKRVKHNVR